MSQIAYLITSDKIGSQDADLGQLLMRTLLTKLITADQKPSHLCLWKKAYSFFFQIRLP